MARIDADAETILGLLAEEVEGLRLGPFEYALGERRRKRLLLVQTALTSTGELTSNWM